MSERMTDEAYEEAEEKAVELAFQECPACACNGESGMDTIHMSACPRYAMVLALDAVLDEATRAREAERVGLEALAVIKALADALTRRIEHHAECPCDACSALRLARRL